MRVIFMGTPDFAVPALEALIEAGHEVCAVVTQPDKAKGRGKSVQFPPVKEAALRHGIEVFQPVRIRESENVEKLSNFQADVIVVVAFGQILPKSILEMTKYGCINAHASLLPKYRGAAPIQWAILEGEKESGVTTMQMDAGVDTGDMILKTYVPIESDETGGSLHDKLGLAGASLLIETLKLLEDNKAVRIPQGETTTMYAKMLHKSIGKIDWTEKAEKIEWKIRGLNPWPSAYTSLNGKTLKLWKASVLDKEYPGVPGEIAEVSPEGISVICKEKTLVIKEMQLEGKKRMEADAFLRGNKVEAGTVLL